MEIIRTASMGCTTLWTVPNGTVPYTTFQDAWLKAGLSAERLPNPVSPVAALGRAASAMRGPRRLPRALGEQRGSWALIDETPYKPGNGAAIQEGLRHRESAKAKLSGGKLLLEGDTNLTEELETQFEQHKGLITGTDLRALLSRAAVHWCSGTPLRPTGGVYFVPASGMDTWRAVAGLVEGLLKDAKVYNLTLYHDPDSIRTVLDGVQEEIASEVEAVRIELQENKLGKRALGSRVGLVEQLLEKAKNYEALLQTQLPDLQVALPRLRATLLEAQLVAESGSGKPILPQLDF